MERLKTIRLQHIRPHQDQTFTIAPQVTVISGANGSGKTSVIEAIYIALQGTSFKGGDAEVLRRDDSWYRIDLGFNNDTKRIVKYDSLRSSGRKQFTINEKTMYRLAQSYKHPAVLFDPDDLRLLNGSPVRRRQFIDRFAGQVDLKYSTALGRYERALKQRNSLLKQAQHHDSLFAWDIALSEYGAYIVEARQRLIDSLNKRLQEVYRAIAFVDDDVTVKYSYTPQGGNVRQRLLADLHAHLERDKLLGATSVGPHRHDVLFSFNHTPAQTSASRGEVRSIVLALKFLEVEIITKITGKEPIILLDDVFSELDETRQKSLASGILHNQTIITTTSPVEVEGAKVITLGR